MSVDKDAETQNNIAKQTGLVAGQWKDDLMWKIWSRGKQWEMGTMSEPTAKVNDWNRFAAAGCKMEVVQKTKNGREWVVGAVNTITTIVGRTNFPLSARQACIRTVEILRLVRTDMTEETWWNWGKRKDTVCSVMVKGGVMFMILEKRFRRKRDTPYNWKNEAEMIIKTYWILVPT